MADLIQIRRDLAANWTSADPTLAQGELGMETDSLMLKIGDGATAWTSLAYYTTGNGQVRIDALANLDYIGNTGADGAIRIDATLSYSDGGNFVTIGIDSTLKSNYDAAFAHISADGKSHSDVVLNNTHRTSDGSDHSFIDQDITSGSSPTLDGANITGVTTGAVDQVHLAARKGSVGTITKGSAVYITGYSVGGWIEVEIADNSIVAQMPAIGIADVDITNSSTQFVTISGTLTGQVTNTWAVGDDLYVDTAGGLTNTKPTGTALIQKVANVSRSHVSLGVLVVIGAGRSNDVSNIPNGEFWLGNVSGVATPTNFDTQVSANSDVSANTTHKTSAGTDHSDVGLNNTHRTSAGTDHSDVGLNNTHRTSDGSDHSFLDQSVIIGSTPSFARLIGMTEKLLFSVNGGGFVITTGIKGDIIVPFNCTITGLTALADQSGDLSIELWKDTYANFPPLVGDLIDTIVISAATKSQETGLSIACTAGDVIRLNVSGVPASITRATCSIDVTRA